MISQHKTQPVILSYDIAKLLKDPTSWLSKQIFNNELVREELHASFMIEKFIQHWEQLRQEYAEELADEAKLRAALAKAAEMRQQQNVNDPQPRLTYKGSAQKVDSVSSIIVALKLELAILLATPQAQMTLSQLGTQIQKVAVNVINQAKYNLPPVMPVTFNGKTYSIDISQLHVEPAAPAEQALRITDPNGTRSLEETRDFIEHYNKSTLNHILVIKHVQALREELRAQHGKELLELGIDIDSITFKSEDFKVFDTAIHAVYQTNQPITNQPITNQ